MTRAVATHNHRNRFEPRDVNVEKNIISECSPGITYDKSKSQ
jgi:hypothetical protein